MIEWLVSAVPIFKAVHISGLVIWCGSLLALPLMLTWHDPSLSVETYRMVRRTSHVTYIMCATPAAVLTVIAGTWLIFLREVFTPWLYAKLAFVALLVVAHAWIGHIVVKVGEEPGKHTPPPSYVPIAAAFIPMLAILVLVLAKPTLTWITFPDWMTEPRGDQLLFDVPSR